MKKQILSYWHGLKDQEQRLLLVASVIFFLFVLIMGVFKPLNAAVEKAAKDRQQQAELMHWVQESVVKLQSTVPKQASNNVSLSQIVNSSRGRFNINISKMQPTDNTLRLTIDSVEFNRLVSWLDELVGRHGVTIENIELSQDAQSGFVRVTRLVLEA